MITESKLSEIRKKIDTIDQEIQKLINQRAQCALEVAQVKKDGNNGAIIYRPEREAQILRKIMERNIGPLPKKDMAEIFLFIMSKCRALQQPIKITVLGPKKSISHKAALKHFGASLQIYFTSTIKKILRDVATKKTNYGIIPIENIKEGTIISTLEALTEFSLQICGEIEFSGMRFWIIGTATTAPSGNDKTSLVIYIANKPGSLAKILQPFANHQVDVSFLEYFPYRGNMHNYVFFVDIAGHQQDQSVQAALQELATQSLTYTLLGSYPRTVL